MRALHHEEHNVTDRGSALQLLEQNQQKNEFVTGLLYVDSKRPDFLTTLNVVDKPLCQLTEEALRPKPEVLAKIMETI